MSEIFHKTFTQECGKAEVQPIDFDKNGDIILKVVKEYRTKNFLANITRMPIIKSFLSTGYRVITLNKHYMLGPENRILWLKVVVVCGLIAGLLLSLRLWTFERFFPLAPLLDNFPVVPPLINLFFFILLIGALLAILLNPKPQKLIFLAVFIATFFAVFDQMRWQPWFYQYVFMLATIGLYSWDSYDKNKCEAVLNTARLIVASIYFFSGLQKMNITFLTEIFPFMVEPVVKLLPDSLQIFPFVFGIFVPFLEMGIGLGLVTKKYRKYAIFLAFAMLCFVLFSLGPLGQNWNSVVWPWNIAMALFVFILFWRVENLAFRDILWVNNFLFQKIILVLFVCMPVLSFYNLWDSYLSSALYSGNTTTAKMYISDSVKEKIPPEAQKHVSKTLNNENYLNFSMWSFTELNVAVYPESRVLKNILRNICQYAKTETDVRLVVNGKQTLFNKGLTATYDCSDVTVLET